ncbi:glycoside hydrolase family 36 protein [Cohnella herbarum]|uniref:Alpha-galactosidase n=1 Tax=Cohnella herbarum TaxID=2728023 RepID=A0A7Z2VPY5_9BACL|nr:glycoside hydrolase family 36 protein [Cohnella herbarum]QJD86820.1 alpha-galactosidase [Cohnella herbarum]
MQRILEHHYDIEGLPNGAAYSLDKVSEAEGLERVTIKLSFPEAAVPPVIRLKWSHPIRDIQHFWHPGSGRNRGLSADWATGFKTRATYNAPVGCLFNNTGRNRLTFAFSDALNPLILKAGVNEETAVFHCEVTLFGEQAAPIDNYEAVLTVDTRDIPYYEALGAVERWWSEMPGYKPASVPEVARVPMYSTWYSFHQRLNPDEIEEQCRLALALGCGAVIVDDGWQTSDNNRGYAYCGDWKVSEDKIPAMKAHVARVHELGMSYLLWYSVPFVGKESRAWRALQDKMLYVNEELGAGIVDPRYPQVREYLIRTYENAVTEWDLDGLKLDFVDTFRLPERSGNAGGAGSEGGSGAGSGAEAHPEMDYVSVPEAVDRLLSDIMLRLQAVKPDIMIEFRQSYTGPLMRKYGNIFRATDCPSDSLTNRVRTLDLRLVSGDTAIHSDMVMWHPEEPVESAALQIVNVLFSVPQISVMIDRLPAEHREMLAFWLRFWQEHREVLLDGKLEPAHPEMLYPLVKASSDKYVLYASYSREVVSLEAGRRSTILVNGTLYDRIAIEVRTDMGKSRLRIRNCKGELIDERTLELGEGLHSIAVPPAGLVTIDPA